MAITKQKENINNEVNYTRLESVNNFNYLEVILLSNGTKEIEIYQRIEKAMTSYILCIQSEFSKVDKINNLILANP